MSNFKIISSAKAVPKKIVTNDDLSHYMDTSDSWIFKRTGIKQRRIATDETTNSMSSDVARQMVEEAKIDPKKIDYIIVATMSSEFQTPSTAAAVQGEIGAENAVAFDIDAACTGFTYGLSILNALLAKKQGSTGILIGAEVLSKYLDWKDRSTSVLFGDGAAGILVRNDANSNSEVLGEALKTFGQLGSNLTAGHVPYTTPFGNVTNQPNRFLQMNGHKIFDFALKQIPLSINQGLEDAGLDKDDIDLFLMHQANARIIKSVSRKMKIDMDKIPINISKYGNTAAASEPLLFAELVDSGKIYRGSKLALVGFGGGLTTGTVIIRY